MSQALNFDLSKIIYKTQHIGRDLPLTYKFDDYFYLQVNQKIQEGCNVKLVTIEFYS